MRIREFIRAFDEVIPLASAGYEKDAVGLQVCADPGAEITRILLAYEITDAVICEAEQLGANLIVCYHPLIFPSVNSITEANRTGMLVARLISASISLYILHTAFDAHPVFGSSALMASALGLKRTQSLSPLKNSLEKIAVFVPASDPEIIEKVKQAMWDAGAGSISNYDECSFSTPGTGTFRGAPDSNPAIGTPMVRESVHEIRLEMICERWKAGRIIREMIAVHPYEEVAYDRYALLNEHPKFGMGTIGDLAEGASKEEFLELVGRTFGQSVLRYSSITDKMIRRVAVLAGAGMEYYSNARAKGADAFITGDIRYHDFYKAEHDGVLLIDAGHSETERFVVSGMFQAALSVCISVDLHLSTEQSYIVESALRPNAVCYHLLKETL